MSEVRVAFLITFARLNHHFCIVCLFWWERAGAGGAGVREAGDGARRGWGFQYSKTCEYLHLYKRHLILRFHLNAF